MTDYKKLCEELRCVCYGNECKDREGCGTCDLNVADAIEELQADRGKWFERYNEAALNWQESARCVGKLEKENERLNLENHNMRVHADYCESERDGYKDEVERLKSDLDRIIQMNSRLQAENERLKKQLDAAVAALKERGACEYCGNSDWKDDIVCRNYADRHACFQLRVEGEME